MIRDKGNFMKFLKPILVIILTVWTFSVHAQEVNKDSLRSLRMTSASGNWLSGGINTGFISSGQRAVGTLLTVTDGQTELRGSFGFLMPLLAEVIPNNPPVATVPEVTVLYEIGDILVLEGFDPDGDDISFEVTGYPTTGDLLTGGATGNLFAFLPSSSLNPGFNYTDTVHFRVYETNGDLTSEIASYPFTYKVEDKAHAITAFEQLSGDALSKTLSLSFSDDQFNPEYDLLLTYIDLSNPLSPQLDTLAMATYQLGELETTGNILSATVNVSQLDFPFLFSADKVFISADVITETGFSDNEAFILNNNDTGSTIPGNVFEGSLTALLDDIQTFELEGSTSDDGLFFTFASERSTPENTEVELNLYAIELGEFDLTNSTIDVSQLFSNGTASTPVLVKNTANLLQWTLTYTPSGEDGYIDEMEFTVNNESRDFSAKSTAKVEVIGVNDAPSLSAIDNQQVSEEGTLTVDLTFADVDNDLIVTATSSDETNLPIVLDGSEITISPVTDFNGLVNVTVLVQEVGTTEGYSKFETFEVEVTAVNDQPVMEMITNQAVDEDNALTYTLAATDVDARVPIFTYEATPSVQGVATVDIVGNQLTITPNENYNGTLSFEVTADDRLSTSTSISSSTTFDLVVNAVNDSPTISQSIPTQNVVEGFPTYTVDLGQYFEDVETLDKDLDFTLGTASSLFSLSITDDQLSITALAGQSGNESIALTVSDGELSVVQNIDLELESQSADIQISNQITDQSLEEDFAPYSIDLTNVFADASDVNAIFTYATSGLDNLSSSIVNGNTLVINSVENYNGSEEIYLIGTSSGKSSFMSFSINVNEVNDAPTLSSVDDQTVQEDFDLTNVFSEFSDIDNVTDDLEFTAISSDQSLIKDEALVVTKGASGVTITASPELNKYGSTTITLTVTDGELTATQEFNLVVTSVNDAPIVESTTIPDVLEDDSFEINLASLFSDVDGDELEYSFEDKPDWLTLSDGALNGNPNNDDVGSNQFYITANDGSGGSVRQEFIIEVINTNDAPTVNEPAIDIEVIEDVLLSSAISRSVFTDVDGDNLTLSASFSNADWLTFDPSNNRFTGTPDNDDVGNVDITITATDGSGSTVTDLIVLTVINSNDDPTGIEVTNLEIFENSTINSIIGDLSTVDVDAADSHTYKLVSGTGDTDNGSFEISSLQLITSDALDFETKSSYSIRVQTSDVSGSTLEKVFTVTVSDINEVPSAVNLSASTVAENVDLGTIIGEILATDEDLSDSHIYALITGEGDVDNALFEIADGKLLTKSSLDFESKASYSVRLEAIDEGGLSVENNLTISISDLNEAPTDISLSQSSIIENSDISIPVTVFSAVDQDVNDSHTFSLVAGDGDTHNDKFEVSGTGLIALGDIDYETLDSYSIRVKSTDAGGESFIKSFSIAVENKIEASLADIDDIVFVDTPEGGSLAKSFVIKNTGDVEIVVTNISVPNGFAIATTEFSIAVGASVDVEITFNPTEALEYSGDIVITSTVGETTIGVIGSGAIVTSLDEDLIDDSDWKIYPNPAKNRIVIDLADVSYLKPSVDILSINGANMWNKSLVEEEKLEVNIGSYPEGTYLVRIVSTKGTVMKKLLIIR
jgi:putative Ig domain-containing protein/type IX secretion system substrate protein/Big-like domain-containing protein/HYDIN/CFA65/VesB family protein/cadherin domain-containing protein